MPCCPGKNRLNIKLFGGGTVAKLGKNRRKGKRIKFGYLKRYAYICTRKLKEERSWDDKVPFLF
jgi:hypothetical protein